MITQRNALGIALAMSLLGLPLWQDATGRTLKSREEASEGREPSPAGAVESPQAHQPRGLVTCAQAPARWILDRVRMPPRGPVPSRTSDRELEHPRVQAPARASGTARLLSAAPEPTTLSPQGIRARRLAWTTPRASPALRVTPAQPAVRAPATIAVAERPAKVQDPSDSFGRSRIDLDFQSTARFLLFIKTCSVRIKRAASNVARR